jgi:hypothetical protein
MIKIKKFPLQIVTFLFILSTYLLFLYFHEKKVNLDERNIRLLTDRVNSLNEIILHNAVDVIFPVVNVYNSEGEIQLIENCNTSSRIIFYFAPNECHSCLLTALTMVERYKDSIMFLAKVGSISSLKLLEDEYSTNVFGVSNWDAHEKLNIIKIPSLILLSSINKIKMIIPVDAYNVNLINEVLDLKFKEYGVSDCLP